MLEDLDFAVDIVLVTSKYEHIQNKTNRLVDNAGKLGLKLNAQKCKVMRINTRRKDKVMTGREEVKDVEEFVYLGTAVTEEGGGTEDIKKRLTHGALVEIQNSNCLRLWRWSGNLKGRDTMRKVGRPKTTWRRTVEKESIHER